MPMRQWPEVQELSRQKHVIIQATMELIEPAFQKLVSILDKALKEYRKSGDTALVTDIHIRPIRETGAVIVSDDDRVLVSSKVAEIASIPEEGFEAAIESELRRALQVIDSRTPMSELAIWKPFSFEMIDDEGESLAELLLVDDDNVLVTESLMEGLDEELNAFLKDLLQD